MALAYDQTLHMNGADFRRKTGVDPETFAEMEAVLHDWETNKGKSGRSPEPTCNELALRAVLSGEARFSQEPGQALLCAAWILLWLVLTVLGLQDTPRRRPGGPLALTLGLLASLLVVA